MRPSCPAARPSQTPPGAPCSPDNSPRGNHGLPPAPGPPLPPWPGLAQRSLLKTGPPGSLGLQRREGPLPSRSPGRPCGPRGHLSGAAPDQALWLKSSADRRVPAQNQQTSCLPVSLLVSLPASDPRLARAPRRPWLGRLLLSRPKWLGRQVPPLAAAGGSNWLCPQLPAALSRHRKKTRPRHVGRALTDAPDSQTPFRAIPDTSHT